MSEPIAGGAGWVGAGLLGLVLGWLLLKHLPAKDQQLTELLTSRDSLMTEQLNQERATCQTRHHESLTELKEQRQTLRALHDVAMARLEKNIDGQKEIRHAIYNLSQQVINWTLVQRHMMGLKDVLPGEKVVPGAPPPPPPGWMEEVRNNSAEGV